MSNNIKNKCKCGNIKDSRSKNCRVCAAKIRWNKYNLNFIMQSPKVKSKRIKNRGSFEGPKNSMFGRKRLDVIERNKKHRDKNSYNYIDGRTNEIKNITAKIVIMK